MDQSGSMANLPHTKTLKTAAGKADCDSYLVRFRGNSSHTLACGLKLKSNPLNLYVPIGFRSHNTCPRLQVYVCVCAQSILIAWICNTPLRAYTRANSRDSYRETLTVTHLSSVVYCEQNWNYIHVCAHGTPCKRGSAYRGVIAQARRRSGYNILRTRPINRPLTKLCGQNGRRVSARAPFLVRARTPPLACTRRARRRTRSQSLLPKTKPGRARRTERDRIRSSNVLQREAPGRTTERNQRRRPCTRPRVRTFGADQQRREAGGGREDGGARHRGGEHDARCLVLTHGACSDDATCAAHVVRTWRKPGLVPTEYLLSTCGRSTYSEYVRCILRRAFLARHVPSRRNAMRRNGRALTLSPSFTHCRWRYPPPSRATCPARRPQTTRARTYAPP